MPYAKLVFDIFSKIYNMESWKVANNILFENQHNIWQGIGGRFSLNEELKNRNNRLRSRRDLTFFRGKIWDVRKFIDERKKWFPHTISGGKMTSRQK